MYGQRNSWSSGPIIMLTVGILSFVTGLVSMIFGSSIVNWFVDPRVLESNGNVVGLLHPTFAADTTRNPGSF
jgi:hypothetical protein